MTLVVASLVERSIAGVSRSSKKAFEAGADLVEIRLDILRGIDAHPNLVQDARGAVDGAAVATLRSTFEGGRSDLKGGARRAMLERVVDSGFEYTDLELARDAHLLKELGSSRGGTKAIASYHFSRPVAKALVRQRLEKGLAARAVAKIAMPCANAAQAVMLAELAGDISAKGKPFVLIGMGAQGQLTRVCASGMRSELAYACLPGKEAAPGQLDVRTQAGLAKHGSVILGLIGHPVSHSVSRPMQEAALRSVDLNGIYLPLDIPPERMNRRLVATLFDIGFRGLNVTIPNKQKAYRLCDIRSESARNTAAVNTLHLQKGKIVGENTDVKGFQQLISLKKVRVKNARILVIGAGGAARAVCKALSDGGAEIVVAARRPKAASDLAKACGSSWTPYPALGTATETYDIMVNTTPIGTKGAKDELSNLPENAIKNSRIFVDLVYNPSTTPSMAVARRFGRTAHGGLEMLVRQGEEAFKIWTGKSPDVSKMRLAARRVLES
ncbi:MAG: shikimate dehydrogenase [Thermoplasmata archaeon]|nr:shikimate dehydrogenase [Thermoplasmata archaeon]